MEAKERVQKEAEDKWQRLEKKRQYSKMVTELYQPAKSKTAAQEMVSREDLPRPGFSDVLQSPRAAQQQGKARYDPSLGQ